MKYLVLLLILAVVIGWFFGRGRSRQRPDRGARPAPPDGSAEPAEPAKRAKAEMLACVHCGLHLPRSEAAFDVSGRPFCTPEHRVAGPR